MAKMVKLTEKSWILKTGDNNNGILFKNDDDSYLVLSEKSSAEYRTIDDVKKRYGSLKLVESNKTDKSAKTFKGFPIKHDSAVEVPNDDLPVYRKDTGKMEFVAGYWGLLFTNGWTSAFCPKLETIKSNESVGPFKNRLEMLNHLSTLNTASNLEKLNVSELNDEDDDESE